MQDIVYNGTAKGYSCYIAYGRGKAEATYKTIKIGTIFDVLWHVGKARFLGKNGFGSYFATKRFIKKLERLQPDILHLHNLHGYYLNLPLFCAYLKRHPEIKKFGHYMIVGALQGIVHTTMVMAVCNGNHNVVNVSIMMAILRQ